MTAAQLAFEITWDPGLRGILVVAVGVAVLCGSVYLLLATNLGSRLGFLVAIAGLSGWMAMMGFVWALYGIGYIGDAPTWHVEEVVVSDELEDLSGARLEKAHDLGDWTPLPAAAPARGEAQASATAALTNEDGPLYSFESEADYEVIGAFDVGGKSDNFFNNWFPGPHPPRYAIVQVQPVKKIEVEFGQPPPPPEVDESQPVYSAIMVRDLGSKRLPPVLLLLGSLIIFGVSCNVLHRRDKQLAEARAAANA